MTKLSWFSFMDMHSGGTRKTKFEYYYVEAPTEEQARAIFTEKTGEDPNDVACPCCGANFSVGGPYDTIEDAAKYQVSGGFDMYEWLQNKTNKPVQVIRLQSPADLTKTVNMVVDAAKIADMEKLLAEPTNENLGRGETLFDRDVTFPDGHFMAIQVIASENPSEESAWCQGVLFDPSGNELGCTDVGESFAGEFQVGEYVCNVIPA